MNGEPMLPRDPLTGHFLPRPKPKRWTVSRTAVEIAVILLLATAVIFVGLAGMAKRRELRAAQADVERLKTVESILDRPDVICPRSTTASGLVVAVCEVDSRKGVITQNGVIIYRAGWVPVNEEPKPQPKPVEWSSGQSVNTAVIAFDASTVDCKFDGSLWMCRAKPQPRRAALPPCAWTPRFDGIYWDTTPVTIPFDPEEERWGKTGPRMLPVDVQNDGGKWVPWHRIEVPRKIQ